MSLFDFVEQHDRVRSATNLFGQLATFFVTDESGRCPDQTADVVLLHVLAHVDVNECFGVTEHVFSQCLGKQRLTDTGRSGEDKATGRTLGIFQTATTAANGFGDRGHGGVLADDSFVQFFFHLHQPQTVFGRQPREWNAGHLADDFGDDFFIDDAIGLLTLVTPFLRDLVLLLAKLLGLITQVRRFLEVLIGDRVFFVLVQLFDFLVDLFQIRWTSHGAKSDSGTRFVDHVDRFVGQATSGDVSLAHFDRGHDRVIGELHAMMFFVAVAKSLQDFDRFFLAGRFDNDLLETSSQGVVFFDVLAVLVQRGRTDALDFAASQRGLEHVGRVDRTFGTTGTDQRVKFVDEQDRVLDAADFGHHRFDSFLELTAILCAGDHHRQVEHDDAFVGQDFRNFAFDDSLCEAFDDGGLAHTRFTQQHGVVLGATAKNLNGSFDFSFASDDGIEFAFLGQFG